MGSNKKWYGIKYCSKIDNYDLNSFSDFIHVDPINSLKYFFIGKNEYEIEIKRHPSGNLSDAGLFEIEYKTILILVPEKLNNTNTYILFGDSGNEIEFDETTLSLSLANELENVLDYIWNNSLSIETYKEYLDITMKWGK